jgi:adenine deaminase
MKISGNLVDLHQKEIYPAVVHFNNGSISGIERVGSGPDIYIMPGLIDAHVHIESSMVTPGAFALAAVSRGTVATVSDPHEIANVLGVEGVKYMINDSRKVPLKFNFGAPSCVPATSFETSGAVIGPRETDDLLSMVEIKYLAEMMNFPGVIFDDQDVRSKIETAKKYGKPVDGHAPGLTGEMLKKYISAGISTDHECSTIAEAREKLGLGMKILIREGSAARNLDDLKDLYRSHPEMLMLCSDDIHPEMLVKGHINKLVARLVTDGYDLFDVLRSCTANPVSHYGLSTGLLLPGQPADFIVTADYHKMDILQTWINGEKVFDNGKVLFDYQGSVPVNKFNCSGISRDDIRTLPESKKIRVIEAFDGELITRELITRYNWNDSTGSDTGSDILKIVVKDRYNDAPPATGFIKGFGMKSGAFASSVAHDSHNIICIGTNDDDIIAAVNEVVKMKGGLTVCAKSHTDSLRLDIAGIMSDRPVIEVASEYEKLSDMVKELGCKMSAPFMTLSFMALLVIPELKLSDRGLFDCKAFKYVPLFVD